MHDAALLCVRLVLLTAGMLPDTQGALCWVWGERFIVRQAVLFQRCPWRPRSESASQSLSALPWDAFWGRLEGCVWGAGGRTLSFLLICELLKGTGLGSSLCSHRNWRMIK